MEKKLIAAVMALFTTLQVAAQDTPAYIVPDPLYIQERKELADLRAWIMDKWQSVRKTNHALYHDARGVAGFQSYVHFCRRHDLNVDMAVLSELALKSLSEIITAHFEENEWLRFGDLPEGSIRGFIADVGHDIYAFEYATAIAEKRAAKEAQNVTTKAFCTAIAKENYNSYIALRATAKRLLGR